MEARLFLLLSGGCPRPPWQPSRFLAVEHQSLTRFSFLTTPAREAHRFPGLFCYG
jgi:hypothetical protein